MLITEIIGKISRSELRDKMRAGVDDSHENLSALLRQIRQNWDKHRYDEIFGPNKYRLSIPVSINREIETNTNSEPDARLVKWLGDIGYTITSYGASALAVNDRGREMRIGKIIGDKNPEMKHIFDTDPARVGTQARKKKYYAVISRSPTDIIQMSTGVGWTSCMNLHDGVYRKYIPLEVKQGTLIAFLVPEGDTKLRHPVSRLLIKPFLSTDNGSVALGVANVMYPRDNQIPEFRDAIAEWADRINANNGLSGYYTLDKNVYNDEDGDIGDSDDRLIYLDQSGKRGPETIDGMSDAALSQHIKNMGSEVTPEIMSEVASRHNQGLIRDVFSNLLWHNPRKPIKWKEVLPDISDDTELVMLYAMVTHRRIKKMESEFLGDQFEYASMYHARTFKGARWPAYENILLSDLRRDVASKPEAAFNPDFLAMFDYGNEAAKSWDRYANRVTDPLPDSDTLVAQMQSDQSTKITSDNVTSLL